MQGGRCVLWYRFWTEDEHLKDETWAIFVLGTGEELTEEYRHNIQQYIATVQDGPFVWHIWKGSPSVKTAEEKPLT